MSDRASPARFGARIAAQRQRRGWSMRELAAKTALSFSTISRAENGHEIWLSAAVQIADALGLSLDNLLRPVACEQCDDAPPPGFTCNTCGRT